MSFIISTNLIKIPPVIVNLNFPLKTSTLDTHKIEKHDNTVCKTVTTD